MLLCVFKDSYRAVLIKHSNRKIHVILLFFFTFIVQTILVCLNEVVYFKAIFMFLCIHNAKKPTETGSATVCVCVLEQTVSCHVT